MKPSAEKRLTRLRRKVRNTIVVQSCTAKNTEALRELLREVRTITGGGPRHKSALPLSRP